MAVGDILVGLDIGFSDLNLVVARVNDFNQLDILFSDSIKSKNFIKGMILDKDIVKKEIRNLFNKVYEEHKLKIKSSYVTIPGMYVDVQQKEVDINVSNSFNEITEEDIYKTIENIRTKYKRTLYTDIEIIPFKFISEDGKFLSNPVGVKNKKITMLTQILYAKNDYIDSVFDIFEELDLYVDGFVPTGLGEKEMFLTTKRSKNNVMLIDFRKDIIETSIFLNDAIVKLNTLEVGTNIIPKMIAYNTEIDLKEAEKLSLSYPNALRSFIDNDNNILLKTSKSKDYNKRTIKTSHLVGITEETLKKIFEKINESLVKSGYKRFIDKIILTGDINNINQADLLTTVVFNISVKNEYIKDYMPENENIFRTYGMLKYVSKEKEFAYEYASMVEQIEETKALKKIFKNIKDFFYS